jgi:hypothetical protein
MFGFGNSSPERKVQKSIKLVKESGSAVSLDKIGSISLRKKTEAAGSALAAKGLQGIRAQAVCVLDYSGSMYSDFRSGEVQELTERFLGFALQIDADGEIPVIPFASRRLPTINVDLNNYQGIIDRELVQKYSMGSTNLAQALEEVLVLARITDAPMFVGVVTDGNPDSTTDTTRLVCELANYPVFIKFLALRSVPYLQELDDLDNSHRLIDNVDTKTFTSLSISDEQFAEAMADEWDSWVKAAQSAGILT